MTPTVAVLGGALGELPVFGQLVQAPEIVEFVRQVAGQVVSVLCPALSGDHDRPDLSRRTFRQRSPLSAPEAWRGGVAEPHHRIDPCPPMDHQRAGPRTVRVMRYRGRGKSCDFAVVEILTRRALQPAGFSSQDASPRSARAASAVSASVVRLLALRRDCADFRVRRAK